MKTMSISLLSLLAIAAAFMLASLAPMTGATIADTVAQMDITAADEIPADLDADIAVLVAALDAPADTAYMASHGLTAHVSDAELIRQCLKQNGPRMIWWNKATDRRVNVCVLPDNRVGFQPEGRKTGDWQSLTEYIKDRFSGSNLKAVSDYFIRNGWKRIK